MCSYRCSCCRSSFCSGLSDVGRSQEPLLQARVQSSPASTPATVLPLPGYRDYLMDEYDPKTTAPPANAAAPDPAAIIGYWRLLDAVDVNTAKDEKGFQDGTYVTGKMT